MKSILLVDDNHDFLDILSYALREKKINIILAYNAEDAINNLKKIKFDLICSDYEMGERNGLELLAYLRENNNSTKFIMLTGHNDLDLQKKVEFKNGIFIDKTTPDLVNKIIKNL